MVASVRNTSAIQIVKTAVQFLQNPKTRASSLKLKILFLKKKGLTEDEIQLAIDRSGTALYEEAKNRIRDATQPQPMLPPNLASNYHQQMVAQPITPFSIVRDIANTVVAIGGIGYLVYWFYTNFIKPWLFGKKKPKPVSDQLTDLEASLTEIKQEVRSGLARVGADLESLANQRAAERSHDLHDLSAQVQTVKGLLLNRSQFPAVPPTTLGSPAKIPSWQLAVEEQVGNSGSEKEVNKAENKMAEGKEKQAEEEEVEDDEDDGDDEEESSKSLAEASDSSLEMINSITNHHD